MSKYKISMNGKVYEMEIELIDQESETTNSTRINAPVYQSNNTPNVQIIDPSLKSMAQKNDGMIVSLMPGTIIKVYVKVGDEVIFGQPLAILEAMKMENEILASKDGVIKSVFVNEGESVPANSQLFELE